MVIAEANPVMDVIANRLEALPTRRDAAEQRPGQIRQFLGVAITATQQIDQNVMRQIPDALPRLSLAQMTEMAGPLTAKAGIRLSAWKPIRLLKNGTELILSVPPQRGLKYLSAQAIQAGVGVVGFHKMEEHLASRRPKPRS